MVKKGIVLGHKVSCKELEFEKAKVEVIEKLPHVVTIKGVGNFLGYARFYKWFIQDFSKIASPMCKLLEKKAMFEFRADCHEAFEKLKKKKIVVVHFSIAYDILSCHCCDILI